MKRSRWSRYENLGMAAALLAAAILLPRMWRDLMANGSVWFRGVALEFWPGLAVLFGLTFLALAAAAVWVSLLVQREPEPTEPRRDPVQSGRRRRHRGGRGRS